MVGYLSFLKAGPCSMAPPSFTHSAAAGSSPTGRYAVFQHVTLRCPGRSAPSCCASSPATRRATCATGSPPTATGTRCST